MFWADELATQLDGPQVVNDSKTPSGTVHIGSLRGVVLHDAAGERGGAVIVLSDVTRLRELEVVRQQFVANVSHELKTPITAIKAAIETLLCDHDAAPDQAQRFHAIIDRQADRLSAIVEDLLALARLEQQEQRQPIELTRCDLASVLHAAVDTCQSQAQGHDITLRIDAEPDLEARVDAALLEQAVMNLLDNAIKYSDEHTQVRVNARRGEGEIVLEVQDHGPGIEERHLERIFERFYRTDAARSRALGGTGLGLAIVKHVAQVHGGRVSVDSIVAPAPDQGCAFRIHLPEP